MKKQIILFWCLLFFILNSCRKRNIFIIHSKDKNNYITVISNKKAQIRYVINGCHYNVPDTNFVKIDISQVPKLGNQLWGCWDKKNDSWEITIEKSFVIENKLDTTKFKFYARLPRDKRGIPHETRYRNENCFIYDFLSGRMEGDAIMK